LNEEMHFKSAGVLSLEKPRCQVRNSLIQSDVPVRLSTKPLK
jgi:hypothetical protein